MAYHEKLATAAGRTALVLLGLSLLIGCERSYQPTVRRNVVHSHDEAPATSPHAEDECPGGGPRRTRDMSDVAARAKRADAARADRARNADSIAKAAALPKIPGKVSDKSVDVPAAKTVAAASPKQDTKAPEAPGKKASEATGAKAAAGAKGHEVRLGKMQLVAPKTWTPERPAVPFLAAQFRLPRAKGDGSDAEVTVAAASHDPMTMSQLRRQLKEDAGDSARHLEIAGNEVVLTDSVEDDSDESESSEDQPRVGRSRVLNAMVLVGHSLYFVTCTGPEKTVGERADEFHAFLQTMKAGDQP